MRWRWMRRAFLALAAALPLVMGCGGDEPQGGAVTAASLKRDGAKIAVVTGTAAMTAAENYFGKKQCLYFDTPPDAYLAVEQGKAGAMVFDRHNLEYVALSRPGLVTLPGDIAEEHIVIGVRKGQEALLEEVNGFIRAYRADGTYAEMRKRWFAVNRPPMPAIARPEAPTRTLRVGMEPMSEPTCFMGEEGPTGFDVEMALRLGAALNARMELVVLPFSGMIAALESGKIDLIISSLNATPERGEKILFSEDYLDTGICVLMRRAALAEGQIASKDQLAGKRVGVLSGTTMDAIARRDLPGCVPVYYNNFADLPIALKSGKIEAFLMEQPQARVLVKQQRGVTFLPEMLSSDAYAVLFAKDWAALCEAFSAEIRKMKADGTLAALDEKWFSNDPARQTLPPRLEHPPKGTLRFATVAELEPFSFMRGDEVVGYDIEVVQRAAAALPPAPRFRLAATMRTAKEVGGDFYDFFPLPGDRIALLIADVSGKGITAALYMMNAKALLKARILAHPDDPALALTEANQTLCANNQAHMFITVFLAILDLPTGTLTTLNAGHNPPLLRTREGWDYLRAKHGPALGISPKAKYPALPHTLLPGDRLLLYTDGVTEAQNPAHTLFGERRLLDAIQAASDSPQATLDALLAAIGAFASSAPQADDITLLTVTYDG